ncbi:hypothetical protein BJ508DRAFT_364749 [Ascobolus immersus RN42]|uniref:Uncharacterized protein n=1 Tax=Ascobolus immersus RN42 TaxID=1160509 RepID=A0A3N4HV39_ASCIM|nr:hypothetical protein BJ508DRAFT_364749 [Ascobolus immersus RN42]
MSEKPAAHETSTQSAPQTELANGQAVPTQRCAGGEDAGYGENLDDLVFVDEGPPTPEEKDEQEPLVWVSESKTQVAEKLSAQEQANGERREKAE